MEKKGILKLQWLLSWLFALILSTQTVSPVAMQQSVLATEARTAAESWLLKDCTNGEQDQLRPVFVKYKAQLEPFFLNVLNDGPSAPVLARFEAAASARFDLRQEALKNGHGLGVSAEALARARKMTRQEYVAREKANFVISYKSRAIGALVVVSGTSARGA